MPTSYTNAAEAFRDYAPELAQWASDVVINRTDVFGQYRRLDNRENGSKSFTAPEESRRRDGALTQALLEQHFAGWDVGHLLGTHAISRDNQSRWIAVDIDQHNDTSTGAPPNELAAQAWNQRLQVLGFNPLLLDSNGNGGFHLFAFFEEPIVSRRAYDFVRWLVNDFATYGLTSAPETFPKQPQLTEQVKYGNWLRLPGRHHTRDHWTNVWCDGWLSGADAVAHLLAIKGDAPELIPTASIPCYTIPTVAQGAPRERAAGDILSLLDGVEQGGRHNALVKLIGHYREHGLCEQEVQKLMVLWDAKNTPALGCEYISCHVHDVMTRYGMPRQTHTQNPIRNYQL